MDRSASTRLLTANAAALSRQIFASLPFGMRLAAIVTKLSAMTSELFGRTVYAICLYNGVEGMPDIKGAPATNFGPKEGESLKSFVDRFTLRPVQRDYGAAFGAGIFKNLSLKTTPNRAEEIMLNLMVKMLDPGSRMAQLMKSGTLKYVENLIYRASTNLFKNEAEVYHREKTRQIPVDDEGTEIQLPSGPSEVERMDLTRADEKALLKVIDEAGRKFSRPDLDTYFELLRDGFDPTDVYRLRLLPSMQENLPQELRLDPTSPHPFSSKREEMDFREKMDAFPNPYGSIQNFSKTYTGPLMQAIQEYATKGNSRLLDRPPGCNRLTMTSNHKKLANRAHENEAQYHSRDFYGPPSKMHREVRILRNRAAKRADHMLHLSSFGDGRARTR